MNARNINLVYGRMFGQQFMRAARIINRMFNLFDIHSAIRFLQENRHCRPGEIIQLDIACRGRTTSSAMLLTYSCMSSNQRNRVTSALGKFNNITIDDAIFAINAHELDIDSNHHLERKQQEAGHHPDEWSTSFK